MTSVVDSHQDAFDYACKCGCAVTMPNLIVMVGLPARGKTYMANRLSRYLNWIGLQSRVFNLGSYRRRLAAEEGDLSQRHDFFRADNAVTMKLRERICDEALGDVLAFFKSSGRESIAIYDATNTTRARRQKLLDFCVLHSIRLLFVESVCDDPEMLMQNIVEVKVNGMDYRDSGLTRVSRGLRGEFLPSRGGRVVTVLRLRGAVQISRIAYARRRRLASGAPHRLCTATAPQHGWPLH